MKPRVSVIGTKTYFTLTSIFACLGLFVTGALSIVSMKGASMPCAGSRGCDLVLTSKYAVVLGVPLAIWGVAYYLFVWAMLAIASSSSSKAPMVVLILVCTTFLGAATSFSLVVLAMTTLGSTCLWCLSNCVIALLLAIAASHLPGALKHSPNKVNLKLHSAGVGLAILAAISFSYFINPRQAPKWLNEAVVAKMTESELIPRYAPRLGSSTKVFVVMLSDLTCSACIDALEELIPQFEGSDRATLVWRSYVAADHKESTYAALLSNVAHDQGVFWEFARKMTQAKASTTGELEASARALGIDLQAVRSRALNPSDSAITRIRSDSRFASHVNPSGTPFFILLKSGFPPKRVLRKEVVALVRKEY